APQSRASISAISKQISFLAEGMGAARLLRTHRTVIATEFGKECYTQCLSILRIVNQATASQAARPIRSSVARSGCSAILNPHLCRFFAENPDITIDFFVTSALPDIIKERIDVSIVLREWPGVKMNHRKMGTMGRVLCASPEYIETYGLPKTEDDLQNHR